MPSPKEIFDQITEAQGRKHVWVAEQAGLTRAKLSHKFSGRPGYHWLPEEQAAIARALGVPVSLIWQESDLTLDYGD